MSVAGTEAQRAQGSADFAFTVGAARRSEQRRILNFVRLSDYIMCDTLQTVLLASVREVLTATEPLPPLRAPTPPAGSDTDEDDDAGSGSEYDYMLRPPEPEAPAAPDTRPPKVLFHTNLLLGEGAALEYRPSPAEFEDCTADVLATFVDSLCSLTRLYGDEGLMEVVMGDKADEVEEGTELQELVATEDYDELVGEVQSSLANAFNQAEEHTAAYAELQDMVSPVAVYFVLPCGPFLVAVGAKSLHIHFFGCSLFWGLCCFARGFEQLTTACIAFPVDIIDAFNYKR